MTEKIIEGSPAHPDTLPGLQQQHFAYLHRQKLFSEGGLLKLLFT